MMTLTELQSCPIKVYLEGQALGNPPRRWTDGSVGYDLVADIPKPIYITPGQRHLIPTGMAIELPPGLEAQVRPRSGFTKNGIILLNSPGTIDEDYRGIIRAPLTRLYGWDNVHPDDDLVRPGDRVAQLVINLVWLGNLEIVPSITDLSSTARGTGGFGHTGGRG